MTWLILSVFVLALNEVFTVTEGQVHQVFINNSIRAVGTAKETKGIVVTGELNSSLSHNNDNISETKM